MTRHRCEGYVTDEQCAAPATHEVRPWLYGQREWLACGEHAEVVSRETDHEVALLGNGKGEP